MKMVALLMFLEIHPYSACPVQSKLPVEVASRRNNPVSSPLRYANPMAALAVTWNDRVRDPRLETLQKIGRVFGFTVGYVMKDAGGSDRR